MFDMKGIPRIDSCLEILKKQSLSLISTLTDWKRFDCENFKYYRVEKDFPFQSVTVPDFFGRDNTDTWYQCEIDVPNEIDIFFNLELQTDSMVFINDNEKFFAINPFHSLVPLSQWKGQRIKLTICIWCGYMFPGYHPRESNRVMVTVAKRVKSYPLFFPESQIVKKNTESYNLYYDVYVLRALLNVLDKNSLQYQKIVSKLHKALLPLNNLNSNENVSRKIREEIKPLLDFKNASLSPQIYSVGNAHLDHAWLWPEKETIRKAARTLSEMIFLMKSDSSFIFMFSQPLHIRLVKKYYPSIYDELFEYYKKGQFEPNGVGLLEVDCMLSSGEGQIRNLIYGRKLTQELFPGYYGDTFYVPDSFGYMASLPQILKKSGVKYIVTSKLGWNDSTRHPFDIFNWKGIDGSLIKAHMIQGAYEGKEEPEENFDMYNQIENKDLQTSLLRPIGEGDGGGGTRLEDLQLIKRQRNLQGLPKNQWSKMSAALNKIFEEEVPTFDDELYLELHRGTYTTQAKNKYLHRKLDIKLHNTEYLLVQSIVKKNINPNLVKEYKEKLDYCWENFIINQFHDILPGSSVECVNTKAVERYKDISDTLDSIINSLNKKKDVYQNMTPFYQNGVKPYGITKSVSEEYKVAKIGLNRTSWGSVSVLPNGEIDSFIVNGREICKSFNSIYFGCDYPNNWDAWDIEADDLSLLNRVNGQYDGKKRIIEFEGGSSLEQEIRIYDDKPRVDFVNLVDWKESHKMLRVSFDHNIVSDYSIYDIPFGHIKRSNKKNLKVERAKFEVPAHNYACQRDEENIIALMNDCKYGYGANKGSLSLSLLRSPKAPDVSSDIGVHSFVYSIFVSTNDLLSVQKEASLLNNSFICTDSDNYTNLVQVEKSNILLDTVKLSENGKSFVFRFRECLGVNTKTSVEFSSHFDVDSLEFVNLCEDKRCEDTFDFTPFEIKTVKIGLKSQRAES